MSKYIDAEKIPWTDLNDGRGGVNVYVTFLEKVARMPAADVVEVVRCGECRFSKDTGDYQDSYYCNHPTHNQEHLVHSRDYCSYGAKMDDVQEVRHGRWENDGHTLACSNCHTINIRGVAWHYCPNCGAKMDTICPFLSDEEVKQPCIEGPCGFECEKMDEVEE